MILSALTLFHPASSTAAPNWVKQEESSISGGDGTSTALEAGITNAKIQLK